MFIKDKKNSYYINFSSWESLHGCLNGLHQLILQSDFSLDTSILTHIRETTFKLLTYSEVRVRQASGKIVTLQCYSCLMILSPFFFIMYNTS